ncbi:MAG: hypothetical protein ABJO27_25160 [Pseudoruegeria sp.]
MQAHTFDRDSRPEQRGLGASISAGVLTCFISPYMMILFPLVLPELMNITTIALPSFAVVTALTFAAISTGSRIIIFFAAQIGRVIKSQIAMRRLNRSLATLLVLGGAAMAFGYGLHTNTGDHS